MSPPAKYVYGIIEELQPKRFSFCGIGDAEVYTINHQKLAAVVSDIELQEIDPLRKHVHAHTLVQDKLLPNYTLLPMGFGMITNSQEDVLRLLEKNYQSFTQELVRLIGKVEVELMVFWNQEMMLKQLQDENRDFLKLRARINAASSSTEAQSLLIEAGKLVERITLDWKERYAERVYIALKSLVIDARLNNPLGVKNILNASFLVERAKESEFQREVYKMDAKYQGKMNFRCVGPLAPYNFINMKLEPVD